MHFSKWPSLIIEFICNTLFMIILCVRYSIDKQPRTLVVHPAVFTAIILHCVLY